MAIYRVQLRIAVNEATLSAKWSNVFFVDAANATEAAGFGINIWDTAWRQAHNAVAFCYEVYAADLLPATSNFAIVAHPLSLNIFGSQVGTGEFMPLFNVARAEMNVANSRPSRKFIRAPFTEAQINQDNLAGGILTGVQNAINLVTTLAFIRDEDGGTFLNGTLKGVTSRRLGKLSGTAVPGKPVVT